MHTRNLPCGRLAAAVVVLSGLLGSPFAVAQTMASPPWAGWARCQIDVQGPSYNEQAIHTWTITGTTPTIEGAFRVYPGTWSVVGRGGLQRTQGIQTLVGQWAINGQAANAPIAVFVRASDGRMFIQARHAQLRAQGAIAGYQQQTIDGKQQTPGQISAEAFEWTFPTIDAAPNNTTISGSSTPGVNGSVGFMQPAGSRGTASCTWQFAQGTAPASPPVVTAQAVPTPSGSPQSPPVAGTGGTTPPASTTPVRPGTPTGTATPPPTPVPSPPPAPAPTPTASVPATPPATPTATAPTTTTSVTPRAPPTTGGSAPGATPASLCTMTAPVVAATLTPAAAYLSWAPLSDPAAGTSAGPTYTVYRADLGLLTPDPFPYAGFTHKSPLSATTTYTYTVEAKYVRGCGSTSVTVRPPRPWAPVAYLRECVAPPPNSFSRWCEETQFSPRSTQYMVTTSRPIDLRLQWSVPPEVVPYGGDNTGWIVRGPGLGVDGKYVNGYCGNLELGCNPSNNPWVGGYIDFSLRAQDIPTSGEYIFTVSPVWDSASGRFYDLSTAAKVVMKIQ